MECVRKGGKTIKHKTSCPASLSIPVFPYRRPSQRRPARATVPSPLYVPFSPLSVYTLVPWPVLEVGIRPFGLRLGFGNPSRSGSSAQSQPPQRFLDKQSYLRILLSSSFSTSSLNACAYLTWLVRPLPVRETLFTHATITLHLTSPSSRQHITLDHSEKYLARHPFGQAHFVLPNLLFFSSRFELLRPRQQS